MLEGLQLDGEAALRPLLRLEVDRLLANPQDNAPNADGDGMIEQAAQAARLA